MSRSLVLQEFWREIRGSTLEILTRTPEEACCWTPQGTSNPILWHAGHGLWLQDLMCVEPLAGQSELPPGWTERFGMDSQPEESDDWPEPTEVLQLLAAQQARAMELLDGVDDKKLSGSARGLNPRRSLQGWVIHGLHDEAKHSGEMFLLWKLWRSRNGS